MSEEVDPTSNEDDVDLDLEDAHVDVTVPAKMPAAENDFASNVRDETQLSAASNTTGQDIDPGSNDQENNEVTVEEPNEASHKTNESLSQTCPDSQIADASSQMTRNIPGKALPVAVRSVNSELPVADKKPEDSLSNPPDRPTTEVQSKSAKNSDMASSAFPAADSCTAGVKSEDSQQSKKHDNKSVSKCNRFH